MEIAVNIRRIRENMKEHHIANTMSVLGLSLSLADINAILTTVSLIIAIGLNIHLIIKNNKK